MWSSTAAKIILFSIVIILFIIGIWEFYPLPNAQQRLQKLPLQGPAFLGMDVPLTASEKESFKSVIPLKRFYRIDQETAYIYVLDGVNNKSFMSDPYAFLLKKGWKIQSEKEMNIPDGVGRLIKLSHDGETKEVLSWFSNGDVSYASPLHYWWNTTLRHLSLGYSGDANIFILVVPAETETLDWELLTENFPALFKI